MKIKKQSEEENEVKFKPISPRVKEQHETLEKYLAKQEKAKIKNMYAAFRKIKGIGGKDHKDASTTIDELLYGENGAWRGSGE